MNKLIIALPLAILAGCASTTTPHYDAHFGSALREAKQKMIINPDAGKKPDSVTGIDGVAAQESMKRYHDSFKTPPPVTNVINIGGRIGTNAQGGGQ